MKDFTKLSDDKQTLDAEAKMLAGIDRIIRKKQKRSASVSLYAITQKKRNKFRSKLS